MLNTGRMDGGRSAQAPAAVVMIRPHRFTPNPQTQADNAFQTAADTDPAGTRRRAHDQVSRAAEVLSARGVRVHLFEDESDTTPDSVFPNNWLSTHAGGLVGVYPMYAPNRRLERRADIIEMLKREYRVREVVDYSGWEPDGVFLEGTGAVVLDHADRTAYAVRSLRSDALLLERFCARFNYEPVLFDAEDASGRPVYHTNVLMCIATDFVLIGLDMVRGRRERRQLAYRLEASGRRVVALRAEQVFAFAGNAIELQGESGRFLVLSQRARQSLTSAQIEAIEAHVPMLPIDVDTIERAGGSIRCMIAGIHLQRRAA